MILLKIKIKNFCIINEILSKHHKTKKIQLQIEGLFNVFETNALQSQKIFVQAGNSDICEGNACTKSNKSHVQHCGNCNQPNYNTQTCQINSLNFKKKDNI